MKGIKENDLKRIFGEVMFNEFITYMKGKTYVKRDNQPVYYSTNIDSFLVNYLTLTGIGGMYGAYHTAFFKVEIEV